MEDSSPFLVIQHIPGMSLREALRSGPMEPSRVADIVRQMGSALHAAHGLGIAHRDLKPENVMLHSGDGNEETVKLIDFGIAKIDTNDLAPNTTTVIVAGTVRYMAPEQFEGKHSTASDLYSMALIVCEMLGGQPDVRALPKSTPAKARAVLESALAYIPEERPLDVKSWSQELGRILGSRSKRVQRSAAGIALFLILVIGAAVPLRWFLRGPGEPTRIIEKVGAFDPLTEGFKAHHDVTGRIVQNPARTGFEGWRVITRAQGYYFRALTTAQKRHALAGGWKLTAVMKAEEGLAAVGTDFAGRGGRFDINVINDGDQEIVRLLTQIVPDMSGLEFIQSPAGQYHEYELTYDPNLNSADLWIDKKRRLTGYRGHKQYQEDRGLLFGALAYRSDRASAAFKSVRFEINP